MADEPRERRGERAPSPALRRITVEPSGPTRQYQTGSQRVTFVPLSIRRRSNRRVLVPPPGQASPWGRPSLDLPLLQTLGKAFYWQRLLDTGEVPTTAELSRRLKLEQGWVAEVLRLTLLAPDIVEAIVAGRQPRHLNLHQVRGREAQIPWDWERQRELFGLQAAEGSAGESEPAGAR
jgi:hypothetical protein